MSETSFDRVISEHLALSKRNRRLEHRMPLDPYRERVDGGSAPSSSPEPNDGPEAETAATGGEKRWLDLDSEWDAIGERELPEFDWGDD